MVVNTLKAYRLKSGLRQAEVAEQLHITQSAVSRWELGFSNPGIDVIPFLAKLYGVGIDDIIQCRTENRKVV